MRQVVLIMAFAVSLLAVGTHVQCQEDPTEQARMHFSFAVQSKSAGDYEEAERQFRKALSYDDRIYNIHYSFGDLLMTLGRTDEAMQEFRQSLALNPEHYNTAAMLARLYYDGGEYDPALEMYRVMAGLKPDDPAVLEGAAGLSAYLGYDDEALGYYDRLVAAGSATYGILMSAAGTAVHAAEPGRARGYALRALDVRPDDAVALQLAGRLSIELNEPSEAAGYYARLAEVEPTEEHLSSLEDIYRAMSDHAGLIRTLERHHALMPEDVTVLGELSEALYADGRLDEGLGYVQKGLELAPYDGRFHILMGEHYLSLGREEEALAAYRAALGDTEWRASAEQLIMQIDRPETDSERLEREFFSRGK